MHPQLPSVGAGIQQEQDYGRQAGDALEMGRWVTDTLPDPLRRGADPTIGAGEAGVGDAADCGNDFVVGGARATIPLIWAWTPTALGRSARAR